MPAFPTASGRAARHRFEGPFFRRLIVGGVRTLPPRLQRASMPLWAALFYGLLPSVRRTVERNLARVLGPLPKGELRARSFRLFVNYAQSVANLYAVQLGGRLPLAVSLVGQDKVLAAVAAGRGAVTVTGHLGPWQITPFAVGRRAGMPPMTVAMAEEPSRAVGEFEARLRGELRIVYTTRSSFALIELASVLRRSEIVGMQLDRDIGGASTMLPFCGAAARFPVGAAMLARMASCPIIPVFTVYPGEDRRRMEVHYEDPIEVPRTRDRASDLRTATARVVAVYERYVRRYPEQWFNFYDFWKAPPEEP